MTRPVMEVLVLALLLCLQSSASPSGLFSPRIDRRDVFIPAALLQLYNNQSDPDLDSTLPSNVNTVRYFTHTESVNDSRYPQNDRFRLHFNMSSMPEEERLTAAELRLSALPVDRRRGPHLQRVLVNDILRPGVEGESQPVARLVNAKVVDSTESITLDILPASQRWRREPLNNHGLLVVVEAVETPSSTVGHQSHVRLRRSSDDKEKEWLQRQPMILTYSDYGNNKMSSLQEKLSRTKRASSMPQGWRLKREAGRDSCRRLQLIVNFADLGLDWILAPLVYQVYRCQGDCHYLLADHLVSPRTVTRAGCVPTAFSPFSVLYLDDDNKVVFSNFQDLVVRTCGCPASPRVVMV